MQMLKRGQFYRLLSWRCMSSQSNYNSQRLHMFFSCTHLCLSLPIFQACVFSSMLWFYLRAHVPVCLCWANKSVTLSSRLLIIYPVPQLPRGCGSVAITVATPPPPLGDYIAAQSSELIHRLLTVFKRSLNVLIVLDQGDAAQLLTFIF